ncbi:MAG TPA: hypothetical protein VK081_10885 [Planctomycetota bacterium]|nr:hypothetical protein [Planctomycetota bacterium]
MSRRERAGLALLFVGALCFLGLFAHGHVENSDAEVTMHAARAWWLRGDPGLLREGPDVSVAERTLAEWIASGSPTGFGMPGRNGKAYVWFPIGHQALMVPCVALGEACARAFPAPETRLIELEGEAFGAFFWSRFFVALLPIPFAAGAVVVVWLLARTLGASGRDALVVTAAATLATAFWPGSSETMSDVPGTFFLLLAALGVFAYRARVLAGVGAPRWLLLAGGAAGAAVCVRYPHAAPVAVLGAGAAVVAWRAGRRRDLAWLAAGGLPFLVALLAANWLRFGNLLETGYSAGATKEWFSYPPWLGIGLILLAPGKGVLWFSPALWPALAQAFRRVTWRPAWPWAVALGCFLVPVVISGHTAGWAAGQCWSVRYVTAGVVLVVTVGLSLGQPWRRRPRSFWAACLLGAVVSLGGVVTPYRGDREMARHAAAVVYAERVAREGEGVLPEIWDFVPRFTPLKSHWVYAWLNLQGRMQRGGSANTTEPLFGVRIEPDRPGLRPSRPQDVGFRHWWWRYGSELFGWPRWPVLAVAGVAALALFAAVRVLGGERGRA